MHSLIWLTYFLLNYFLSFQLFDFKHALLRISCVAIINIGIYIFCFSYLVPKFFKSKNYLLLISIAVILIFISYFIRLNIEKLFIPYLIQNDAKNFTISTFKIIAILPQALIILVACLLSTFREVFNKELVYNATKLEESNRELELIKAKVNPHFLLNTLNNIYAINYQESPKTSEAIIQLSKVLSFTIYKSKNKLLLIQEEIELLEALIGLYQLKFYDKLNINFTFQKQQSEILIPSMVLFSLLENALKHSDLSIDKSTFLKINLELNEGFLLFEIENSISEMSINENENQVSGGLGANAITQILKNQYGNDFSFDVFKTNSTYKVILKIKVI